LYHGQADIQLNVKQNVTKMVERWTRTLIMKNLQTVHGCKKEFPSNLALSSSFHLLQIEKEKRKQLVHGEREWLVEIWENATR
jgi:hypothetical protein